MLSHQAAMQRCSTRPCEPAKALPQQGPRAQGAPSRRALQPLPQPAQQLQPLAVAQHCQGPLLRRSARAQVVATATQSVDPLAAQTVYSPGKSFLVHSLGELEVFTQHEPGKHKLTVLMAKASHCRPCKKFASTYHAFAAQFSDCQLLEIVGDESKETRKMMVDMKVRVTPSFFLYRDGKEVASLTGTKQQQLRTAILQNLKPGEARTPDLTTSSEEDDDSDDD